MHATVDGVKVCDGLRMGICKVKKLCINDMWIAFLIDGCVAVKM